MKLNEWLLVERGRGKSLAVAIGVSPVLISQWSTGPRMPPIERCVPIERATHGEVTRQDLRTEDWRDIWPELAQAQAVPAQPAIKAVAFAQADIKHLAEELLVHGAAAAPAGQDKPSDGVEQRDGFIHRSEDRKRLGLDINGAGSVARYV